jgi:Glycosyltransferase family 87
MKRDALGCALVVGVVSTVAGFQHYTFGDFWTFWHSARAWLDAGHFYVGEGTANMNLPHVAVGFVPLALLPLPLAMFAWQFLNLGLLVWVVWTLDLPLAAVVALLLSPAWNAQACLGQLAMVVGVLVLLAWRAARTGRDLEAAVWIGLAIAAKPFILPVLAWWLVRRQWRALAVVGLVVVGTLALGAVSLGAASYVEWYHTLPNMPAGERLNVSLQQLGRGPWAVLAVLLAAGSTWAATRVSVDRAWFLLLLAGILISPLGWAYYGVLLIGPLSVLQPRWALAGLWIWPALGGVGGTTLAWCATWAGYLREDRAGGLDRPWYH